MVTETRRLLFDYWCELWNDLYLLLSSSNAMAEIRRKQALAIAVMAYLFGKDDGHQKRKIPRPRSVWVRDWLRQRDEKGAYSVSWRDHVDRRKRNRCRRRRWQLPFHDFVDVFKKRYHSPQTQNYITHSVSSESNIYNIYISWAN